METKFETKHEAMTMESIIRSLPRIANALEEIVKILKGDSDDEQKKD